MNSIRIENLCHKLPDVYSTRINFVTNFFRTELFRTEPNYFPNLTFPVRTYISKVWKSSVRFDSVRKSSVRKNFVTKSMRVLYQDDHYVERRSRRKYIQATLYQPSEARVTNIAIAIKLDMLANSFHVKASTNAD